MCYPRRKPCNAACFQACQRARHAPPTQKSMHPPARIGQPDQRSRIGPAQNDMQRLRRIACRSSAECHAAISAPETQKSMQRARRSATQNSMHGGLGEVLVSQGVAGCSAKDHMHRHADCHAGGSRFSQNAMRPCAGWHAGSRRMACSFLSHVVEIVERFPA